MQKQNQAESFVWTGHRGRPALQEAGLYETWQGGHELQSKAVEPTQRGPQAAAATAERNIKNAAADLSHVWKAEEVGRV